MPQFSPLQVIVPFLFYRVHPALFTLFYTFCPVFVVGMEVQDMNSKHYFTRIVHQKFLGHSLYNGQYFISHSQIQLYIPSV